MLSTVMTVYANTDGDNALSRKVGTFFPPLFYRFGATSRIAEEGDVDNEPLLAEEEEEERRLSFGERSKWPVVGVLGMICTFVFVLSTVAFGALYFKKTIHSGEWPKASDSLLGKYATAAVAADNTLCSEIGRDILLKGGNAVDSAVATLFCIGVLDTQSAGIGGGHLMTIFNATTRKCSVIDAREKAPLAATEDMYRNRWNRSLFGWEAVAVPGELHGLRTAFDRFGGRRLSWSSLIQPTIELMKEGYPTSHALAFILREYEQTVLSEPSLKKHFVNPKTGKIFKVGEQIRTRKNFIETLQLLANSSDPLRFFYDSDFTEKMVSEFKTNGGILSREDFRSYKSIVREKEEELIYLKLSSEGLWGCGPPPPSSAAVTLSILSLLDPMDLQSLPTEEFIHRLLEATKFGYAQRSHFGDPDFVPDSMKIAKNITSAEWANEIRRLITGHSHPIRYYGGDFNVSVVPDHGTSHISVVDKHGNAVSVTSTINFYLGAQVMSESTGILWNDEMDDFSIPGHPDPERIGSTKANLIAPGKRPQSSMSPLIFFDRSRVLSIGAAGGTRIISGVASVATHILKMNADLKEAIDRPRLHNQLQPQQTEAEPNFPQEFLKALERRGQIFEKARGITVVTAVERRSDGNVWANSDFRKGAESEPAGY